MTTIRIEDYMARSYLDELREKYEPKAKEKKFNTSKWVALSAVPLSMYAFAEQAKASGTYYSVPGYSGTFHEEQMISVAAMQTGLGEAAKQKIISAFDPLIDLIIALSLPISGVMLAGGALMIMVGMKDAGFKLIMNAGLGYVLVQMSPLFIQLLAGVGAAI